MSAAVMTPAVSNILKRRHFTMASSCPHHQDGNPDSNGLLRGEVTPESQTCQITLDLAAAFCAEKRQRAEGQRVHWEFLRGRSGADRPGSAVFCSVQRRRTRGRLLLCGGRR